MSSARMVREGRQSQGVNEAIAYRLTTTPWGTSPGSITVTATNETLDGADVSATVLSGVASVSGDVISTPVLSGLTAGHLYRVAIRFACGGNTFEAVVEVAAER